MNFCYVLKLLEVSGCLIFFSMSLEAFVCVLHITFCHASVVASFSI